MLQKELVSQLLTPTKFQIISLSLSIIWILLERLSQTDTDIRNPNYAFKKSGSSKSCSFLNLETGLIARQIPIFLLQGERESVPSKKSTNMPSEFKRLQFPVSFAKSINKSQGQSLKMVGLHFMHHCFFFHGQLYVRCSRGGNGNTLFKYQTKCKNQVCCSSYYFTMTSICNNV